MANIPLNMFWIFSAYILMLFVMGLYCLLVTQNIVRALIGIEILMKAVTLLIIIAGQTIGNAALSQAMIITLIVIETVFIAVAMGIVLCVYKHSGSLDTNNLTDLKGQ